MTKVLHIVENLDRGAVENWLVRMMRHARRQGIALDWTFYCALGREGKLDAEVRQLGGRIIHSLVPIGQKTAFIVALRHELAHGGYEVLHSHHDLISGLYLLAAAGLPIRKCLVHVHNADEAVLTPNPIKQRMLRPSLRHLCLRMAEGIIGISNHTLDTFLAGRKRRLGRDRVHYYGIDGSPFLAAKNDRSEFRRCLGLPAACPILLFAGRMVPEKNPLFALEVLAEMRKRNPQVVGVFVGAGSLEAAVRERANQLRVDEGFRALGWRNDIAEIMCCCDWFILPRPEQPLEGLGIAVIEAQVAGLRLLLSQGIPDDPLLKEAVCARLSLADGPQRWAKEAIRLGKATPPSAAKMQQILAQSPFDMDFSLRDLLNLYS
jgi:glycosyltransferase involved in cell wall biosynthesis